MLPGERIDGKYRVVGPLGAGGMGAVFEAVDDAGQCVAIKLLQGHRLEAGAHALRRFEREARAAAAAESPYIVKLLSAGFDGVAGAPYIAMELLRGEDLRALLKRAAPLDPDLAVRIAIQACRGLADAHRLGVVHRDIKPGNLFLAHESTATVRVKLLDFGLAKLVRTAGGDAESASLTASGNVLGSPAYMSPEQALGYDDSDVRSDVWSLGIVLYEALTGRTPFGERGTLGQLLLAICSEAPPPLRDFAPWVDTALAAVVHRALSKSRSGRFASIDELHANLLPFASTSDISAAELATAKSPAEGRTSLSGRGTGERRSYPPPRASGEHRALDGAPPSIEAPWNGEALESETASLMDGARPTRATSSAVELVGTTLLGRYRVTRLLSSSDRRALFVATLDSGEEFTLCVARSEQDADVVAAEVIERGTADGGRRVFVLGAHTRHASDPLASVRELGQTSDEGGAVGRGSLAPVSSLDAPLLEDGSMRTSSRPPGLGRTDAVGPTGERTRARRSAAAIATLAAALAIVALGTVARPWWRNAAVSPAAGSIARSGSPSDDPATLAERSGPRGGEETAAPLAHSGPSAIPPPPQPSGGVGSLAPTELTMATDAGSKNPRPGPKAQKRESGKETSAGPSQPRAREIPATDVYAP